MSWRRDGRNIKGIAEDGAVLWAVGALAASVVLLAAICGGLSLLAEAFGR